MIVALVIALAASALAVSHLTNERAAFLRQRIPHWEAQLESLRALEHTTKSADVNDNLTQAKINKLTVQLEKARFELDGVDPKSVDMRNHKPVEANTAEVRKNVIAAEIAALRVQIDAAATPELRQALGMRFNALQKSINAAVEQKEQL